MCHELVKRVESDCQLCIGTDASRGLEPERFLSLDSADEWIHLEFETEPLKRPKWAQCYSDASLKVVREWLCLKEWTRTAEKDMSLVFDHCMSAATIPALQLHFAVVHCAV